jgi:hypothetical protein
MVSAPMRGAKSISLVFAAAAPASNGDPNLAQRFKVG